MSQENTPEIGAIGDQINALMNRVYELCEENGIPLLFHAFFKQEDLPNGMAGGTLLEFVNLYDIDNVPPQFMAAQHCLESPSFIDALPKIMKLMGIKPMMVPLSAMSEEMKQQMKEQLGLDNPKPSVH
jgi:hypothetical protein